MFNSPIKEVWHVTVGYNQWYFLGRHKAIDLRTKSGKYPKGNCPIYAVANGKYIKHGYLPKSYGNYIILEHKLKAGIFRTLYAHLSKVNQKPGWSLRRRGDRIGTAGNTGLSTGPHLHFSVRQLIGDKWIKVDPMPYFIEGLAKN